MKLKINHSTCIQCQRCIAVCPLGALSLDSDTGYPHYLESACIACGHCTAVCPTDAITISGESGFQLEQSLKSSLSRENVFRLMKERRSIRVYDQKNSVSIREIAGLVEAASQAPTGRNRRPVEFQYFDHRSAQILEEMASSFYLNSGENPWLKTLILEQDYKVLLGAPGVLYLYADKELSDFDCGLLSQNILLMAQTVGIALCCNGIFKNAWTKSEPIKSYKPIISKRPLRMVFSVGYPDQSIPYLKTVKRDSYPLTYEDGSEGFDNK